MRSLLVREQIRSDGSDARRLINRLTAYAVMGVLTNAFIPIVQPDVQLRGGESDPLVQIAWALVVAVCTLQLVARWASGVSVSRPPPVVVILIALAACSILWSVDPSMTSRRVASLAATLAVSMYIASTFSQAEFVGVLARFSAFGATASLAWSLFSPTVFDAYGEFRGIFVHKNSLGFVMALGAATGLLHVANSSSMREVTLRVFGLSLIVVCLLRADSATSLLSALAALGTILTIRFAKSSSSRMVMLAVSILVTSFTCLLFLNLGPRYFLSALGKDSTLTGRTDLWDLVQQGIDERPFLGWGFGSFWSSNNPGASPILNINWGGDTPASAHNGFLEMQLALGWTGLILVLTLLLLVLKRGLRHLIVGESRPAAWYLAMLVFTLVYNTTESNLLQSRDLLTAVLLALVLGLETNRGESVLGVGGIVHHASRRAGPRSTSC